MKRILCASMVLILLLNACSATERLSKSGTTPNAYYTHGVYEFSFDTHRVSGWPFERWDFSYTHDHEEIESGHRILLSLSVVMFYRIQVKVTERDTPENIFTKVFSVPVFDGGSDETKITVTNSSGKTAVYKVTCDVAQVGKQYSDICEGYIGDMHYMHANYAFYSGKTW